MKRTANGKRQQAVVAHNNMWPEQGSHPERTFPDPFRIW